MQATKVVFLALIAFSAIFNSEAATLGFRNEKNIGSALDIIKQMVEENINVFKDMLKEMKGSAKDCLVEEMPNIIALVQKQYQDNYACTAEQNEKIKEVYDKLIASLAEDRQKVQQVIADIQNCSNGDCYKENGGKLIEIVGDVSAKVIASVHEHTDIINASPATVQCLVDASENFYVGMKEVHARLVTCVKG